MKLENIEKAEALRRDLAVVEKGLRVIRERFDHATLEVEGWVNADEHPDLLHAAGRFGEKGLDWWPPRATLSLTKAEVEPILEARKRQYLAQLGDLGVTS